MSVELSYVLPVHDDERTLPANVATLAARLARHSGGLAPEIVLVENGSRDRSWEICQRLAQEATTAPRILTFREDHAGIGYAYARALTELSALHGPSQDRWAVLTGADLPFAFSDLDRALPVMPSARAVAGSKAHPRSRAWAGGRRFAMSIAYRAARRAVLGMKIGDSQGSLFLRLDLVAEIAPRIRSRDFFYTTELAYLVEQGGERFVEVPVDLEAHQLVAANSSVRPLKHASQMLRQLVALRRRA